VGSRFDATGEGVFLTGRCGLGDADDGDVGAIFGPICDHGGRVVGGGIVHEDDLVIWMRLGRQRVKKGWEGARLVSGRHDHGNRRRVAFGGDVQLLLGPPPPPPNEHGVQNENGEDSTEEGWHHRAPSTV
jgi:hypothetical protein